MQIETAKVSDLVIRSSEIRFLSRTGCQLIGFLDVASDCPDDAEFVIITPKFGESKKNNLDLAYQLAANHMRVLRFDHANHVGESEGEIENYTFSGAIADIQSAIDFLEINMGVSRVQVVANSLSARCALRVASMDSRVSRLVTLVGVVNFQHTARVVYQKDMVEEFRQGRMQGISDILGHQVDVDAFLTDCIQHDLHDLNGSINDVLHSKTEMFFLCAERDVWVDLNEVSRLRDCSGMVNVYSIGGAMHELRENPKAAQQAVLNLIFACRHGRFGGESSEDPRINVIDKKLILAQNKIERERLRKAAPLRKPEQDFWKEYLDKYNILEAVGDYQEYLELIGRCLGPIRSDMVYFDCGCGNGMFGAWCIRDILKDPNCGTDAPPVYFALDLTAKGLRDATQKHSAVEEMSRGKPAKRGIDRMYLRFDLDELNSDATDPVRLPLADGAVDRLCCSLLISYLKDPEELLDELFRVLKPGGQLILSSMKPYCDLSVIYKDVVTEAKGEETLQSARNLLSAAGAIRLKEEEGHYKFYEQEELEDCLLKAGFSDCKAHRSFGDQVNLVHARK